MKTILSFGYEFLQNISGENIFLLFTAKNGLFLMIKIMTKRGEDLM